MTDQEKYIELTATIRGRYDAVTKFLDGLDNSLDHMQTVVNAKGQKGQYEELLKIIDKLNK